MFDEINNYQGSFGDPIIDAIDFSPIDVLELGKPGFVKGAGIALLVNFANHIDNSTYKDALTGQSFRDIQLAIKSNYCSEYPLIFKAFTFATEEEFYKGIKNVYIEYVQKDT